MTSDRLTRPELTWLLAQEARSAAQKLRQGVGMIATETTPPPAPSQDDGTGGVESTLNRLDEAVSMLASLHGRPMARGRRGRVDLTALLWEVAPEARVQIEMGEGTTVFGDETELRRMLQVLIAQGGDPTSQTGAPDVSIRRVGDEVSVRVNLGPETPVNFETERVWLSRMALRYGGRLELDGLMQTLTLPAEVDLQRLEVESLKKELAAAQAQGEAYARELAAVFSRAEGERERGGLAGVVSRLAGSDPVSHLPPSGDSLAVLVAAARVLGTQLRGILSAIGRDIAPLRSHGGDVGETASSVGRHVTAASETVSDLARLGACPLHEFPRHCDVADLLRDVVKDDVARAARHDVRVVLEAPEAAQEVVPQGALTVLLHALLDHAISASPPGSEVVVTLVDGPSGIEITFDDAGPALPAAARSVVLSRDFEAVAQGRPPALPLIAAHAIAAHTNYGLVIEDGPRGETRVRLTIPRSG
ncbi:sensor histidine kinase [Sorangium sp. So ce1024]|uniref:sensor histidine kinase n=1 Tax=Sorangium sp. So ce1024 TaxID=3133327 RepID=UPI003F014151